MAINSCTPGFVLTDMTRAYVGPLKTLTPEEGAATIVHLMLQDLHGISGKFWRNCAVSNE